MNWFDVDKKGLAALLEGKSKAFILQELLQNAWDTDATKVNVTLTPMPGRPLAEIVVEDDHPDGFRNLADAWTLYADGGKRDDETKRGRFCLGEKLVLALCDEATIESTMGTVVFDRDGRRVTRHKRPAGSRFHALVRMTREEVREAEVAVRQLFPPQGQTTTFCGEPLLSRAVLRAFETALPTERADPEGVMRHATRLTAVRLREVFPGETAHLYEMGIPVVELEAFPWHVDVGQRVLLNSDRDNVTPGYLRAIRVAVLNAAHDMLTAETAAAPWVQDASGSDRATPAAVRAVVRERFGEKVVVADPSDREGTKMAGENVRRHEVALPAGKVTPSPRPFHLDGAPLKLLPTERWSTAMHAMADFASDLGNAVVGAPVCVRIADDAGWPFRAAYSAASLTLTLNAAALGDAWFARRRSDAEVLRLLIHEFAHHFAGDHLSAEYHEALCRIGARVARLALEQPNLFNDNH